MGTDDPDGPSTPIVAVLNATAATRDPDGAAALLASWSTDRLIIRAGGVRHLARALSNPALGPLLGHAGYRVASLERIGGAARVRVEVRTWDDGVATFLASTRWTERGWRLTGLAREEAGAD
ncbi:MAG: hypothetical protein WD336_00565 [Trueperaceae bacterium]